VGAADPGTRWLLAAAALLLAAWGLTLLARRWNRRNQRKLFYAGLASAAVLALAGGAALLAGPWQAGLDPTSHVYPATVWILVIWTATHVAVGVIMQLYCVARRLAGRMDAHHDIDMANVALYWHFAAIEVVVTVAVTAGFPYVA
jgi:cytochrome c oxidase subunit I+III